MIQKRDNLTDDVVLSIWELRERIALAEHGLRAFAFGFQHLSDDDERTPRYVLYFNIMADGLENLETLHDTYVLALLLAGEDCVIPC